jgi:hypothetical protein
MEGLKGVEGLLDSRLVFLYVYDMRTAVIAALFSLALLSLSCGSNDDSPAESTPGLPNVILPLQVGNSWEYQRSSYDSQGSIVMIDTVTERIARDTIISGERWYIWQTPAGLSMGTLRSDGYWSLAEGVPALIFLYPASVNQTYMIGASGPTMRIAAVDTLISALGGTFPCIAYEQRADPGGERVRVDYCAANTGLVRSEEFSRTPGSEDVLARRYDLIEFHLH